MLGLGLGINKYRFTGGGGSNLDPDAQAFLTAAGITDPNTITATNYAFIALKTAGYYASGWNMSGYTSTIQCFTLYPNLGASASVAKFNMCNPADTNAAYRKTYFGGVTFDSYGEVSNGTNGYAQTHLNLGSVTDINSVSMGFYSFTNSGTGDQYDMGVFDSSAGNSQTMIRARTADFMFAALNQDDPPAAPVSTDSTGFHAVSRVNGTQEIKNIRGTNTTNSRNSIVEPTLEQYLMCVNFNNLPFGYSVRKYGFQFHAAGQTGTQLNVMEQIIEDYMIALGRI
jgi:phage terminase large subunit-like protein